MLSLGWVGGVVGLGPRTAWADPWVVYDDVEDPELVRRRVSAQAALDPTAVDLVPLSAVRAEAVRVFGDAKAQACTGEPSSRYEVEVAYNRAAGAWSHQDAAVARQAADEAVQRMGCLKEPADALVGANLFVLRGSMEMVDGHESAAKGEWATALAFVPGLPWNEAWAPGAGALFESLRGPGSPVTVDVVPLATRGPWVDGVALTTSHPALKPGLHLLQQQAAVGVESLWLTVAGPATVVRPDVLPSYGFADLSTTEARVAAAWVLRTGVPTRADLWWSTPGALYRMEWNEAGPLLIEVAQGLPTPPVRSEPRRR